MQDTEINYTKLIDEAMHLVVKRTLEIIAESGMPGDHHFYISFLTQAPGVALSSKLKQRYPEEMTIVLQYQFEELKIFNDYFSVKLSFEGMKETIVIPFNALTAFADPSVKFGLQFKYFELTSDTNKIHIGTKATISAVKEEQYENADNIVSLDTFRNKNKKK